MFFRLSTYMYSTKHPSLDSPRVVFSVAKFRLVHLNYHFWTSNDLRVIDKVLCAHIPNEIVPISDGIIRANAKGKNLERMVP